MATDVTGSPVRSPVRFFQGDNNLMLPVESQPVNFKKALERARKLESLGEFFLDASPLKDVSNLHQDESLPKGKEIIEKLLQNVRVRILNAPPMSHPLQGVFSTINSELPLSVSLSSTGLNRAIDCPGCLFVC